MAINPQLLVSAAVLQLYFVDKDTGLPMANGTLKFYQDDARTFFKNIYYQTGVPGDYTYVQAPNPLTLSAAGTPQDDNGNDILLFYYPFDEDDENTEQLYYVRAFNSDNVPNWTREGFPFEPEAPPSPTTTPTLKNLIVNNVFWRNVGSVNISALNTVLAPSSHEGLTNPDIRYIKDVNDGTDVITFTKFTEALPNGVTPEYYCNFHCTAGGTSSSKVIQFPINLHVQTLNSPAVGSVAIWIQNVAGNTENTVEIYLNQFLGTGAVSSSPILITPEIKALNQWTRYTLPTFVFPDSYGESLSGAGDDAYYLQVSFPAGVATNINFTQPELYLSTEVADNDFQSYDDINSIISSPRTGDIRTSLNTFSPFGWVSMNDGTIGSASSGASTRANVDTFQLYSTLWNNVSNTYAPVSTGRGASAYADFVANKTIALTKTLGRVLASVGLPSSGSNVGTTWALGQTTGNELHTLSIAEMPAHNHTPSNPAHNFIIDIGGGGNIAVNAGGNAQDQGSTANTGGGSAFNIQNPITYLNVFIKL